MKTKVEKVIITEISITYELVLDGYSISVIKDEDGSLTVENHNGNNEFIFDCSEPETLEKIGELLKQAANLVCH
jgi:hypothetical protein